MPILGLVLTLGEEHGPERELVIERLTRLHGLELGPPNGRRQPAVLETNSSSEADQTVRTLGETAGVVHVDVVYADFADSLPETPGRDPAHRTKNEELSWS